MRPELEELACRTNLTEADLQALLEERERCLREGDELGYAHCLLVLAHVVKWVRPDNNQMPFERANSLALEASEILERLGDTNGVVSALLAAAPGLGPGKSEEALEAAMKLAKETGDELLVARVMARQAASMGMSDPSRAEELYRESLEIYKAPRPYRWTGVMPLQSHDHSERGNREV